MKKIMLCITVFAFILVGCVGSDREPDGNIIPQKCDIMAGQDFPFAIEGKNLQGTVNWSVTKGTVNPQTGPSVVYTAPQEPGPVVITALVKSGNLQNTYTLLCNIVEVKPNVSAETAPEVVQIPESIVVEDEKENLVVEKTIAITEVMASPCTNDFGPDVNEYIELYNYGSEPVDVGGWWVGTNNHGSGTPDQIVTWDSRHPIPPANIVITNSTIIPPKGFAVIISPFYHLESGPGAMPYSFPEGTIILSIKDGKYLGNDDVGLRGFTPPLSVAVLYTGTETNITEVVSTYGGPTYGLLSQSIEGSNNNDLPIKAQQCYSVERLVAPGADVEGNWRLVRNGNPGSGDYGQ